MPVGHEAYRHRVAERHIHRTPEVAALLTVPDALEVCIREDFRLAKLGLAGDVADGAGLRTRPEESFELGYCPPPEFLSRLGAKRK